MNNSSSPNTNIDPEVANMEGDEALPRKNGELVFDSEWEGRVFGLAVALNDRGLPSWIMGTVTEDSDSISKSGPDYVQGAKGVDGGA